MAVACHMAYSSPHSCGCAPGFSAVWVIWHQLPCYIYSVLWYIPAMVFAVWVIWHWLPCYIYTVYDTYQPWSFKCTHTKAGVRRPRNEARKYSLLENTFECIPQMR